MQPATRLRLPHPQRMVVQRSVDDAGRPLLQLFYAHQEISFDDPSFFPFGETLARQNRFAAGDARGWAAPGCPHAWPAVRDLLAQLVEAGVLQVDGETGDLADDRHLAGEAGRRPSPLPPARSDRPRRWQEAPGLIAELTGRPLELGWLELVVPIFRVAHMAMDGDGRQVGEANAFPPALRVDVPTTWRTCIYPGSRHLHDKPMNVSALKAMRAHWGPMMAMLLRMRSAYLQRCPEARLGWTVGHLERLATAVLALPAWQLMRCDGQAQDTLHPVLSSMFRVTDGLRMTMHHMLFIPFGEPTRHPDTPMTAAQVHAYAERAFSFIGEHGVCAGPKAMVDEFLAVVIDGATPRDGLPATLEPALEAACADIGPAIDYAMLGLQAYAAVFSLWPLTMRAYERLAAQADAWAADEPTAPVLAWQAWLQPIMATLRGSTHLATEQWRADRERVYGDMHAQCHRVRTGRQPERRLAETLAPQPMPAGALWALHDAVQRRFGPASRAHGGLAAARQHRAAMVATLADYLARAKAVVTQACAVQAQLNQHLGRPAPQQPFLAADIDLYVQLAEETAGRVPFLLDALAPQLGLASEIGADRLQLRLLPRPGSEPAPVADGPLATPTCRHGVDNAACPLHAVP